MFKPGDLVRYTNVNSRWNGTLWRVTGYNDPTDNDYSINVNPGVSVSLEQAFSVYMPGYSTTIASSMLRLEHRRGSFGKWFREHGK